MLLPAEKEIKTAKEPSRDGGQKRFRPFECEKVLMRAAWGLWLFLIIWEKGFRGAAGTSLYAHAKLKSKSA